MEDRWKEINKTRSYAQAAGGHAAGVSQAIRAEALSMAITEDKRIIVRLSDTITAETISEQLREKIIKRIREGVGAAPANRQVVVVRKLRNEDLAIFVDSPAAKKKMKSAINWVKRIISGAVVKKRTWPILIYRVKMADYPQRAKKEHARRIEKENEKFHLGLKVLKIRWLERVKELKDYALLIVKVLYAEQANRIIREGVVI
jgi:hypothetical protein